MNKYVVDYFFINCKDEYKNSLSDNVCSTQTRHHCTFNTFALVAMVTYCTSIGRILTLGEFASSEREVGREKLYSTSLVREKDAFASDLMFHF